MIEIEDTWQLCGKKMSEHNLKKENKKMLVQLDFNKNIAFYSNFGKQRINIVYITGGQLYFILAVEEPGPLPTKENSTSVEPPGRDIKMKTFSC